MPDIEIMPPVEAAASSVRQPHPRGLFTLFCTEMWERFSYYGMRALLVLYMVDTIHGGMGLSDKTATAIYGVYTAFVYLMALPGGWLGDRLWGAQRTVWIGGIIIALGHFTLALPVPRAFFLGLIFVVIGSGMLKSNMSALVGELYPEGGTRRDAGFSIFYMGVNLGAFIGPMVCGWLAQNFGWHFGFAAAGVGMVLGLIQFFCSRHLLGTAGVERGNPVPFHSLERLMLAGGGVAAIAAMAVAITGTQVLDAVLVGRVMAYAILALTVVYFGWLFLLCGLSKVEKERVALILVLFVASALFWAGFEQAGSSFNLFAERYTARHLAGLNFEVPAAWFQAFGPIFIITLAPVFAWLWVALARRNLNPSIPVKFGLGLLQLAAGFVIMAGAARVVAAGNKAWPTWLIATYLVHTFGELCLSPVGLSSVTKLAPRRLVGQLMGTWFLATSIGNLLAGMLAGEFSADDLAGWPRLYLKITILPAVAGLLLIVFSKQFTRLMTGVK